MVFGGAAHGQLGTGRGDVPAVGRAVDDHRPHAEESVVGPLPERAARDGGFGVVRAGIDGVAGIVRGLREGKVLAILPDLRAKGGSYSCRYLGAETEIPNGMARFAREAGVPIVPAFAFREGWGRHVLRGFDPIQPDPSLDREEDGRRMTQYVMDCFDRAVREHPDQYFWFNKRWVLGREKPPVNPPST